MIACLSCAPEIVDVDTLSSLVVLPTDGQRAADDELDQLVRLLGRMATCGHRDAPLPNDAGLNDAEPGPAEPAVMRSPCRYQRSRDVKANLRRLSHELEARLGRTLARSEPSAARS